MLRKAALLVAFGLAAVVVAGCGEDDLRPKSDVTVLYIGADDCAPCRTWRRDHWPRFSTSSEFARITYREVVSPKLFAVLQDEYWPDDLRGYRADLGKGAGVPQWIAVADGKVAFRAMGLGAWEQSFLPQIRRLLR